MSTPFSGFPGYTSRSFTFKTVNGVDLKLEALVPVDFGPSPTPVVIHYHGGFLVCNSTASIADQKTLTSGLRRG